MKLRSGLGLIEMRFDSDSTMIFGVGTLGKVGTTWEASMSLKILVAHGNQTILLCERVTKIY